MITSSKNFGEIIFRIPMRPYGLLKDPAKSVDHFGA